MTPEDRAAHYRQMAADYTRRADETASMIATWNPTAAELAKWARGEKADRESAAAMIRRAERAESLVISPEIA